MHRVVTHMSRGVSTVWSYRVQCVGQNFLCPTNKAVSITGKKAQVVRVSCQLGYSAARKTCSSTICDWVKMNCNEIKGSRF